MVLFLFSRSQLNTPLFSLSLGRKSAQASVSTYLICSFHFLLQELMLSWTWLPGTTAWQWLHVQSSESKIPGLSLCFWHKVQEMLLDHVPQSEGSMQRLQPHLKYHWSCNSRWRSGKPTGKQKGHVSCQVVEILLTNQDKCAAHL